MFLFSACWIVDCMFSQVLTPKLQAGCEATYVVSCCFNCRINPTCRRSPSPKNRKRSRLSFECVQCRERTERLSFLSGLASVQTSKMLYLVNLLHLSARPSPSAQRRCSVYASLSVFGSRLRESAAGLQNSDGSRQEHSRV